jgi:centrosomal protein CEP104
MEKSSLVTKNCTGFVAASKLELFSSNEDTNTVEEVETINWDYLGYITLSDNQSTGFKSRELKSANVPVTTATYVKLKLGKNHPNSHNNNNQVGIHRVLSVY